jgi:hypothetical protein
MYCHNTALVNQYIHDYEMSDKRHESMELAAWEKAEELISLKSDSDNYQSVMLSIYDDNKLSLEFDELVHAVVNNATVESVQKLQEFMNEVAFEVAKKEISEKINRLKIYGCDIDDVQYQDDDPFFI